MEKFSGKKWVVTGWRVKESIQTDMEVRDISVKRNRQRALKQQRVQVLL